MCQAIKQSGRCMCLRLKLEQSNCFPLRFVVQRRLASGFGNIQTQNASNFFTADSLNIAGNTLVHLEESRINNLFLRISKCEQIALCLVLLNHVTSINFHDLTKTECV